MRWLSNGGYGGEGTHVKYKVAHEHRHKRLKRGYLKAFHLSISILLNKSLRGLGACLGHHVCREHSVPYWDLKKRQGHTYPTENANLTPSQGPHLQNSNLQLRDKISLTAQTTSLITHAPLQPFATLLEPTKPPHSAPSHFTMAPKSKDKYSILLPTYNERRNLPIITWLLNRTFTELSVSLPSTPSPSSKAPQPQANLRCAPTETSTGSS